VTLSNAFILYLRNRKGQGDLVAALQRAGRGLEAGLLMDWTGGIHPTETDDGRRAWVGQVLPPDAKPGDLWLDVVEVMPMLYVPRAGNASPLGWLALRPVERWQFAGFLEVAWTRGGRKAGDFHPLDRSRLLAGPETEPVTRVLRDEASLYAQWFGKLVPSRIDWQLAAEVLDPAPLWGAVPREWGGEEWEDVYSVTELDTLELEDDLPEELIHRAWEAPDDVGFRTMVGQQYGLITETAPEAAIRMSLRDQAPRDR
jgi:hypothetical protein